MLPTLRRTLVWMAVTVEQTIMKVAGFDLSITSPGFVLLDDDGSVKIWRNIKTDPKMGSLQDRIHMISATADEIIRTRPDLIIIEEYAFSRGGKGQIIQLAELGGVIKELIRARMITFSTEIGSHIKLWATGFGDADKRLMLAVARKTWPECPTIKPGEDVADAYHLARYGQENYEMSDE